jgi:hypothetical protein
VTSPTAAHHYAWWFAVAVVAHCKTKGRRDMGQSDRSRPVQATWLEAGCSVIDERCVGVTVSRKLRTNGVEYDGAVTVEIFGDLGRRSNEELDSEWPDTWSGDESATLTPSGARRLAQILNSAADAADAYRKVRGLKT